MNPFMSSAAFLPLIIASTFSSSLSSPLSAAEKGDITLRAGITQVSPQEKSDPIALNGSVSTLTGILGDDASLAVDNNTQLGLTAEYRVTRHWGIELLAATPFQHTATGKGALSGTTIADFSHLPPTLSAVYHFDTIARLQPYVGLGVNYTFFFDEEVTSEGAETFESLGLENADVDLKDSVGVSWQLGADYHMTDTFSLNASIRWIDIDTEAEVTFENSSAVLSTDISVDPVVYTLAFGYTL